MGEVGQGGGTWQAEFDELPVGVLAVSAGRITWASGPAAQLIGRPRAELVGSGLKDALPAAARPDDPDLLSVAGTGGPARWVRLLRASGGTGVQYVVLSPAGQEMAVRRQLAASRELFSTSMMRSPNGLVIYALDGRILAANPASAEMFGMDPNAVTSLNAIDVLRPQDVPRAGELFRQVAMGEVPSASDSTPMRRPDGSWIYTNWTLALVRDADGNPEFIVAQYQDLTAEQEARRQLEAFQAFDEVTGLLSRTRMLHALDEALTRTGLQGGAVAAMVVDIDGFRRVNDSLGHRSGDELLRRFGHRLAQGMPEGAQLGRIAGDQFLIVVRDVASPQALLGLAEQVQAAASGPITINGRRLVVTSKIGMAIAGPGATGSALLHEADLAHHAAQAMGRGARCLYDGELARRATQRMAIEEELRVGLARSELVVHLQPVVRLSDGGPVGFEALVRWAHPTRGLLAPGEFLGVAEDTGLIAGVGQQVIDIVCRTLGEHPELPGRISINVSAGQFGDGLLAQVVAEQAARHRVPLERLVVEVTETAVISGVDLASAALTELRTLGVGVHMDDFGTGYSSISLLRDLPVTGIKLDRSFVADLTGLDRRAGLLAAGLAGLAEGLGLESVAEGIETSEQARIIAGLGWRTGQGYLFGRPAPVEHWLAAVPGVPVARASGPDGQTAPDSASDRLGATHPQVQQ